MVFYSKSAFNMTGSLAVLYLPVHQYIFACISDNDFRFLYVKENKFIFV